MSGSLVILSLGLFHWVWYSVPIMMVMGLSQTHFIVSNQTLVQTIVPDTLRGRVSSVWDYEQGLIPLFAGIIGVMAEGIGIAAAMSWVGGVALALSLFFLLRFKEIRALD
jgi:Transmembrane secretion effector